MAPQPELSVVITTWNRADLVTRAISSALAATEGIGSSGAGVEVVVVDDGSTDATAEVLDALDDPRVVVVHQANTGLAAARNHGVAVARGEWVAFLDDDDELLGSWGAAMGAAIEDPDCGLVSGGALEVDGAGRELGVDGPHELGPLYSGVRAHYYAGCFAVRRDVYDAAGGYLPGLCSSHQSELLIRLAAVCAERGLSTRSVDRPVARIERRAAGDRPLQHPRLLLDGTRWVLSRHAERFRLDPDERGSWESVVAVAAARCGRWDVASDFGRRAVWSRPRDPRAWARAAALSVPGVGRRVWGRAGGRGGASAADRDPLVNAAAALERSGAAQPERFFLPWRYAENPPASADRDGTPFWEGGTDHNDVRYQDAVYKWAARLAGPVVVDVGCGSGHKLVRHVAPRAGTVIGVDQPSGIAVAARTFPQHRWVAADLDDPAVWEDLRVLGPDLVICSDVIEHVEDPLLLLRRLGALAGPEGRIVLSTPDRTRLERDEPLGPPRNPRHVREWSADELELLVESAGFAVLDRRHFLPRRYSATRTDLNRTVHRALHRRAVPDRRSSFALLLGAGRG
ncbi:MAG: glycosyltransferase [Microthrixaceae bacterium]